MVGDTHVTISHSPVQLSINGGQCPPYETDDHKKRCGGHYPPTIDRVGTTHKRFIRNSGIEGQIGCNKKFRACTRCVKDATPLRCTVGPRQMGSGFHLGDGVAGFLDQLRYLFRPR